MVELLLRGTELLAESEETSEALISACANGHPGRSRFRSGVFRSVAELSRVADATNPDEVRSYEKRPREEGCL